MNETSDTAERYLEERRKVLDIFARWVIERPEKVSQLRDALMFSASMMQSNRQETVDEFQAISKEIDRFLVDCKTGKLDPHDFLIDKSDSKKDDTP